MNFVCPDCGGTGRDYESVVCPCYRCGGVGAVERDMKLTLVCIVIVYLALGIAAKWVFG